MNILSLLNNNIPVFIGMQSLMPRSTLSRERLSWGSTLTLPTSSWSKRPRRSHSDPRCSRWTLRRKRRPKMLPTGAPQISRISVFADFSKVWSMFRQEGVQSKGREINLFRAPGQEYWFLISGALLIFGVIHL